MTLSIAQSIHKASLDPRGEEITNKTNGKEFVTIFNLCSCSVNICLLVVWILCLQFLMSLVVFEVMFMWSLCRRIVLYFRKKIKKYFIKSAKKKKILGGDIVNITSGY